MRTVRVCTSVASPPFVGARPANRFSCLLARVIDSPFSVYSIVVAMSLAQRLPGGDALPTAMIMLAAFTIPAQLVLLATHGQTIGKRFLDIRIVSFETGQNAGFGANVVMRAWVKALLSAIPFYGLVDVLFIFRDDQRTIHDLIAGTHVVE